MIPTVYAPTSRYARVSCLFGTMYLEFVGTKYLELMLLEVRKYSLGKASPLEEWNVPFIRPLTIPDYQYIDNIWEGLKYWLREISTA